MFPVAKGPGFLQLSVQPARVLQPETRLQKGLIPHELVWCEHGFMFFEAFTTEESVPREEGKFSGGGPNDVKEHPQRGKSKRAPPDLTLHGRTRS